MPFVKNDTRINRGGRPVGSKNNATTEIRKKYLLHGLWGQIKKNLYFTEIWIIHISDSIGNKINQQNTNDCSAQTVRYKRN